MIIIIFITTNNVRINAFTLIVVIAIKPQPSPHSVCTAVTLYVLLYYSVPVF